MTCGSEWIRGNECSFEMFVLVSVVMKFKNAQNGCF